MVEADIAGSVLCVRVKTEKNLDVDLVEALIGLTVFCLIMNGRKAYKFWIPSHISSFLRYFPICRMYVKKEEKQ